MEIENTPTTGLVLEIQRMSTEDGPGIRTTVFMKGCPMKCRWCHNPESISPLPQVHWFEIRCIGCKTCLETCPNHTLTMTAGGLVIDRSLCAGCGECAQACPSTAIELLGKKWDVDSLAKELLKDREYFEQSHGGVTISGGESLLQWKFVAELLKVLKDKGIHICIDTCGIVRREALDAILPYTDIVLFDLKEADPERHREYTGAGVEQVHASLSYITSIIKSRDPRAEIWIRTPLIPGATAREDNIANIGAYIAANCDGLVSRWDLLPFNNLCKDKYLRLGLDWPFQDTRLLTREEMEAFARIAKESGVCPEIVNWSM